MKLARALTITALAAIAVVLLAAGTLSLTQEVLVGTSPTKIPRVVGRSFELQNRGPNSIFCGAGYTDDGGCPYFPDAGAVVRVNLAREIPTTQSWSPPAIASQSWCCVASSAQSTGAATILTEAP